MENTSSEINEQKYPIRGIWILKNFLGTIIGAAISIFFILLFLFINIEASIGMSFYFLFFIFFVPFRLLNIILRRATFKYSFEEDFIVLKQGIISRQERNLPYVSLQNVIIQQSFLDKVFGLSTLIVENASQMTGGPRIDYGQFNQYASSKNKTLDPIGFQGNKVVIPGLADEDAQALKKLLLVKLKETSFSLNNVGL